MKILVKHEELSILADLFQIIKEKISAKFSYEAKLNGVRCLTQNVSVKLLLFDLVDSNNKSVLSKTGFISTDIRSYFWDYCLNSVNINQYINIYQFADIIKKQIKERPIFDISYINKIQNYIDKYDANTNIFIDKFYLPIISLIPKEDGKISITDVNGHSRRFDFKEINKDDIIPIDGLFNTINSEYFGSAHAGLFATSSKDVAYELSTKFQYELLCTMYMNNPLILSIKKEE